jgi:hypothetical protein
MAAPDTVDPLTARRTWRTVEPLHGTVYFAPEATAAYAALGLHDPSGYFASRSAPLGAVTPATVVATFFNFRPALVESAMAGVWDRVAPAAVLAARVEAATAALRRLVGDGFDPDGLARAAALAGRAAEEAGLRCEGRPLAAAHAALPWPEDPLAALWHAQSVLREYRGDGHLAALVTHDLDAVAALVLHAATGEVPVHLLRATRGWTDDEWGDGVDRMRAAGWVTGDGSALTPAGSDLRQRIEDLTDRLAAPAYAPLGDAGCAELRALARPWSRAVVDGSGLGGAA